MLNYMNLLNDQHLWEKLIYHKEEKEYIQGVPSFTRLLYFLYLSSKNNHLQTNDILLHDYLSSIHYIVWMQIDYNHIVTINKKGDVLIGHIIEKIDDPISSIPNRHITDLQFILNFENQSLLESIEILNEVFNSFELKTETWRQFIHRLYDQSYMKLNHFYKKINLHEQGKEQYKYSNSVYYLLNSLYIFYLLEPFILLEEENILYVDESIKPKPLEPLFVYCDYLLISFEAIYADYRAMSIISSNDIIELLIHKDICYTKENQLIINIDDLFE